MSAIGNIGAFAGGMAQGVGTGMDLYAKYQEIQDASAKKQKQQAVEQKVMEMQKAGGSQDKIAFMDGIANAYFEQGLPEEGMQYYNMAQGARKAKAEPMLWQGLMVGEQNPQAMVQLLQQAHDTLGDGQQLKLGASPTGGLQLSVNGQTMDFGNPDQLHHYMLKSYEPALFGGMEEYGKYENERMKAEASSASDKALADQRQTLTPLMARTESAQAGAYGAQAAANTAQAEETRALAPAKLATEQAQAGYYQQQGAKAGEEAKYAGPKAEADVEQSRAAAELNRASAANIGKGTPKRFADMVHENLVGQEPLTSGPAPASTNPDLRIQVGSGLQDMNPTMTDNAVYGTSAQLLDDAQAGRLQVDPQSGHVMTADGKTYKVGPEALRALASVAPAAAGVGP